MAVATYVANAKDAIWAIDRARRLTFDRVISMEGTIPPTIGGRYRTLRLLGRGAIGAVYEVEHVHTGQHLALKILLQTSRGAPDAIERFKREARASSRIKSENVVRVTDADVAPELDGAPFLVMELLEGSDLEKVDATAASGGELTPQAEVLMWLRQIARALDKAHALGIVHRDLKPENLFLTQREDGTPLVKILDFGLAKFVADDASSTRSGQLLGTPMYMSPEQASSDGSPITPRSDLFSLGLIAFRFLVGRDYWGEGSIKQVLTQILVDWMPPASAREARLGPAFDTWFAKACNRDVESRFATAHEQIEALAEALSLPTISAVSDSGNSNSSSKISAPPRSSSPRPRVATSLEVSPTLNASTTSAPRVSRPPGRTRPAVFGVIALVAVGVVLWLAIRNPQAAATTTTTPIANANTAAVIPLVIPSVVPVTAKSAEETATPAASVAAIPVPPPPASTTVPMPAKSVRSKPSAAPSVDPLAGQR